MIVVPTPPDPNNSPDISYVQAAARSISPKILHGACIIVESTAPVGTTEREAHIIAEMQPGLAVPHDGPADECDIALVYCAERVLPGKIVAELAQNCRVIGGIASACGERAAVLYSSFVKGDASSPTHVSPGLSNCSETASAMPTSPLPTNCR